MSTGFERVRPVGKGLANAALYCGLVGLVCAIAAGIIFTLSSLNPEEETLQPRELMARSAFSMLLYILMLTCGVLAVVLGALASSRAKRVGSKPLTRGRLGFYIGLLTLIVFVAIIVINFINFFLSIGELSREYRDRRFA